MATLLLIVLYMAFVGLGIPDSLIGSAWPAIYTDLSVPVDAISGITLTVSGCTVLSSMFSTAVLNRFGTAKVTVVSTAMTAAAMLGFSFVPRYFWLIPIAAVLGLGAGAIDAGLNNYISLHYSVGHMNFLHCFYGIGVSLSPYLMSLALKKTGWRWGYRYAFLAQAIIAVLLFCSLPLWKKDYEPSEQELTGKQRTLSIKDIIRLPGITVVWILMIATNAIEYACGTWGSTYLVQRLQFSAESGALALTLYYGGLATGRLASGLLSKKIHTWKRIGSGCAIASVGVLFLLLSGSHIFSIIGLCLIGLGNGSVYPNLIHLTPHNFGRDVSQSVMGSEIAFAYIGVMLAPPLVGIVTRIFGFESYPFLLCALMALMIITLLLLIRLLKRENRYYNDLGKE
ncbi:MAG: MFS transporter [Clostridia bacterium]|nr:MFS transporter [Clostridia bacterium]